MSALRRRLGALVLVALAATVTGCGSSAAQHSAGGAEESEIARVALAYTRGLLTDEAAALVAPESREAFATLQAAAPKDLRTSTSKLAIGTVTVHGDKATAVYTGSICKQDDSHPKECESNKDPDSDDPLFIVNLIKVDGAWKVTFPRPSGSYTSSSSCSENGVEVPC